MRRWTGDSCMERTPAPMRRGHACILGDGRRPRTTAPHQTQRCESRSQQHDSGGFRGWIVAAGAGRRRALLIRRQYADLIGNQIVVIERSKPVDLEGRVVPDKVALRNRYVE